MSKTLKELFDEHGSVWLANKIFPHKVAFKPLGYSTSGNRIIGESAGGIYGKSPAWSDLDCQDFILYTEPKKKTKKYLWVWFGCSGECFLEFYEDENDLRCKTKTQNNCYKVQPESWIEVEE